MYLRLHWSSNRRGATVSLRHLYSSGASYLRWQIYSCFLHFSFKCLHNFLLILFPCYLFTPSLSPYPLLVITCSLVSLLLFHLPSPSHFHNRCHILQQIINSSKFQSLFPWPCSLPPPFLPILPFSFPSPCSSLLSPHLLHLLLPCVCLTSGKERNKREWRANKIKNNHSRKERCTMNK